MNDHDEESAFLKAIIENPDEDLARLAYADWLQDRDRDAQAEFIRRQIKAADLAGHGYSTEIIRRLRRGDKPLKFEELLTLGPWERGELELDGEFSRYNPYAVPGWVVHHSTSAMVCWRRGFVEGVQLNPGSLASASRTLRWSPVREILLRKLSPGLKRQLGIDLASDPRYITDEQSATLVKLLKPMFPNLQRAVIRWRAPVAGGFVVKRVFTVMWKDHTERYEKIVGYRPS